jgi:hypothetical protein
MKARITRGSGFSGVLMYVLDEGPKATGQKRPEIISTNLPGSDAASLSAAFGAFRRLRPDIKKPVWHSSLRLPAGERLSSERWAEVVAAYLQKLGFDEATPFLVARHSDVSDGDHVHAIVGRVNGRGECWLGQHEVRRAIEATQQIEREFGLALTPGLGDADTEAKASRPARKADSQSVVNANRSKSQPRIDTTETARVLLDCASRSRDLPTFTTAAAVAGIKVLPNRSTTGRMSGLSVIPKGRKKPLALSAATRNRLSWSKLLKVWDQNAEAAEAARRAAKVAIAGADQRAVDHVAARLAKQPASVSQSAQALPPRASVMAKEPTTMDDKLDFLDSPPPRPTGGVPLDDAGLVSVPASPRAAPGDEDAAALGRREELEREASGQQLQAELRRLSVKELLDLRRPNVPDLFILAAVIERLLSLVLRLIGLPRANTISAVIAGRRKLAELADAELDRRRGTPASASERRAQLGEYEAALRERVNKLDRRQSLRSMPLDAHAAKHAARERLERRQKAEALFDQQQTDAGEETIKARRAKRDDAEAALKRAEAEVPVGMGLVMIPKARAAAINANASRAKRVAEAAARAKTARAQLQLFLDQIEAVAVRIEARAAEAQAVAEKAEAIERANLARELRALPEQVREAEASAQRARVADRAAELVADASRPPTQAAEAEEREALRRRLAEGG